MKARDITLILVFLFCLGIVGCASVPKQTVELAEVTGQQIAELNKSHIRFVEMYYDKLREEANNFVDNRWTPLFLSKIVQNKTFRKDLDEAYMVSNIDASQISIKWKGQPLPEPQNTAVLSGVERAITDYRGRLGGVLLDFSEEAQNQINATRKKLSTPIDSQERMVINEINSAYSDLQRSQAAIKGYLSSAVELKEKQELMLEKLGILEKSKEVMDIAINANDKLSAILKGKEEAEGALVEFLEQLNKTGEKIQKAISGTPDK